MEQGGEEAEGDCRRGEGWHQAHGAPRGPCSPFLHRPFPLGVMVRTVGPLSLWPKHRVVFHQGPTWLNRGPSSVGGWVGRTVEARTLRALWRGAGRAGRERGCEHRLEGGGFVSPRVFLWEALCKSLPLGLPFPRLERRGLGASFSSNSL